MVMAEVMVMYVNSMWITLNNLKFIDIDRVNNLITCTSNMTVKEVLDFLIPKGYFSGVPGTQNITIGGAVANDIHGKIITHLEVLVTLQKNYTDQIKGLFFAMK